MKIDFDMLETMVAAGASGEVILAAVRKMDARAQPKRTKDAARIKAKRKRQPATPSDIERHEATSRDIERLSATPDATGRSRLFGLVGRITALGLPDSRARSVLGQWAKITHDNVEAIEKAIEQAERKKPADAIGFIRACLQERNTINGQQRSPVMDAFDNLIARAEGGEVAGDRPMRDVTPGRA